MMNSVMLHGSLGEKFGKEYRIDVRDPAEAVRALSCQLRGFKEHVMEGEWTIIREMPNGEFALTEQDLMLGMAGATLHIIPVIGGSSDKGIGKIIGGVALVGLAFATGGVSLTATGALTATTLGASIGMAGLALALGGLSLVLAPQPKLSTGAGDSTDSSLFGDDLKTSGQNFAVPLAYGRCRVGLLPVASKIVTNEYTTGNSAVSWVSGPAGALIPRFANQN